MSCRYKFVTLRFENDMGMKQLTSILFVVAALVMSSCSKSTPKVMPDVPLADMYGNTISANELINPKGPLMITFFATWCDPCCQELNVIKSIYPELQKRYGLELVVVSIDKYPNQVPIVANMLRQHGWDRFRFYFDVDRDLTEQLHVQTIPSTLYVCPDGKIFEETVGYDGATPEEQIRDILDKMTAAK